MRSLPAFAVRPARVDSRRRELGVADPAGRAERAAGDAAIERLNRTSAPTSGGGDAGEAIVAEHVRSP